MTSTKTDVLTARHAVLACVVLFFCWNREGWMFQVGILYAGAVFGSLVTEALNHKENKYE